VLSDLDSIGYTAGATVIPACAVGAGHRRDRLWIIAHAKCTGWEGHKQDDWISGCSQTPYSELGDGIAGSWNELAGCRGSLRQSDGLSVGMVRSACKGAGNAIVPQVAASILGCIKQISESALPNAH
jgi:DNA (cytosine-5)-methyltransferase 1